MDHENSFLGTSWAFPPSFDYYSKSVEMVSNEKTIKESLQILLTTTPGERPMEPTYGCDLSPLAFQRLDLSLKTFMINNIKSAILAHEPRIYVNAIKLELSDDIEGMLHIVIDYTIKSTNTKQNFVYPYYLEAGVSR